MAKICWQKKDVGTNQGKKDERTCYVCEIKGHIENFCRTKKTGENIKNDAETARFPSRWCWY